MAPILINLSIIVLGEALHLDITRFHDVLWLALHCCTPPVEHACRQLWP